MTPYILVFANYMDADNAIEPLLKQGISVQSRTYVPEVRIVVEANPTAMQNLHVRQKRIEKTR